MLSLDSPICSDHTYRVASLDLDSEVDIPWSKLVDEEWSTWTADKLQERWASLKSKVDVSATHRGEYIMILSRRDVIHDITQMSSGS